MYVCVCVLRLVMMHVGVALLIVGTECPIESAEKAKIHFCLETWSEPFRRWRKRPPDRRDDSSPPQKCRCWCLPQCS